MVKIAFFLLLCGLLATFMITIKTFSIIPLIGMVGIFYSLWWPFDQSAQSEHTHRQGV